MRKSLYSWWLCCFLAACTPLQAATRVALIGSGGHQAAEQCLALAEVELSGGGDIALVERREIAKLLAEGQLSLGGMVNAATAIRAGKLLGADVLAVVETDPQSSQALGILAFETGSGMHLCDRALAEDDPEQAGRQIAQAVRLAVRKRALGPGRGGPSAWSRSATPTCRCRPTPCVTAWGGLSSAPWPIRPISWSWSGNGSS